MNNLRNLTGINFISGCLVVSLIVLSMTSALVIAQEQNRNPASSGQPGVATTRPIVPGFVALLDTNDTDKSGTLSATEAASIRLFRPALFKALDLNGDGEISRTEAVRGDEIDSGNGNPVKIEFEGKSWRANHAIGAQVVDFKGKQALHIAGREQCLVYLPFTDFKNGTIEVDIAGDIFSGIVFRIREDGKRAEKLYFRPQNANTEKHGNTVQYAVIGREDGHWSSLRRDFPGKYESGADIQQGEWFHARLVVKNQSLKVYVNNDPNPVLEVDPLLDGISTGSIGVWGWDSYFANYRVKAE